jgi:hypothetical protein
MPKQHAAALLYPSREYRATPERDHDGGAMGSTKARHWQAVSWNVFLAGICVAAAAGPVHATGSASPPQKLTELSSGRAASDDELRSIWARGWADRLFENKSAYLAGGNAVTILGDMAILLNPVLAFLDADTEFTKVAYDPNNPSDVSGCDGAVFIRLPKATGEINFRNLHISDTNSTNSASFGDISMRGIDFGGTTVKVTYRP